jgi:hypothetical protein
MLKQFFTKDEIKEILEISINATDRLCKTITQINGMFARKDIIRACIGGKIIDTEDIF